MNIPGGKYGSAPQQPPIHFLVNRGPTSMRDIRKQNNKDRREIKRVATQTKRQEANDMRANQRIVAAWKRKLEQT